MRADEILELESKLSATVQEALEEQRRLHEAIKDSRKLIKKYEDEIKEAIQAAVIAGFQSIDENAKVYLHERIDTVVNQISDELRNKLKG
jgi:vacuolar-type H+-ATPase subunit H